MTEARTAGRSAPDARLRDLPHDLGSLPGLPPAYHDTLDRGLAVLGVVLAPAARAGIDGHVALLLAWNDAINLTAITDPAGIAMRHVLDSLSAVPVLEAASPGGQAGRRAIVDLGSGGGFPGLSLAAALPRSEVTLVESVGKKARFLEATVAATGLADRVHVRAARAEALASRPGRWDVVTARAVGSLPDLVELALPILRIGGYLVAWKRGDIGAELAGARRAATAMGGGEPITRPVASLDELAGHVLVTVAKVRGTPAGFPRDPAKRANRPW